MDPFKLIIQNLKLKLNEEKIARKPQLLAHYFLSMIYFETYYLRIGPLADPVWLWPIVLDCVKLPSSYLPLYIYIYLLLIGLAETPDKIEIDLLM